MQRNISLDSLLTDYAEEMDAPASGNDGMQLSDSSAPSTPGSPCLDSYNTAQGAEHSDELLHADDDSEQEQQAADSDEQQWQQEEQVLMQPQQVQQQQHVQQQQQHQSPMTDDLSDDEDVLMPEKYCSEHPADVIEQQVLENLLESFGEECVHETSGCAYSVWGPDEDSHRVGRSTSCESALHGDGSVWVNQVSARMATNVPASRMRIQHSDG